MRLICIKDDWTREFTDQVFSIFGKEPPVIGDRVTKAEDMMCPCGCGRPCYILTEFIRHGQPKFEQLWPATAFAEMDSQPDDLTQEQENQIKASL